MPEFTYRAKTGPHNIVDGAIQAQTLQEAVQKIMQLGQTPIDVRPAGASEAPETTAPKTQTASGRVPLAAAVHFTRSISDLLEAGVPLLKSLELLGNQNIAPTLKPVIAGLVASVKNGASLSSAMGQHPRVFNTMFVNMVRSGESSGNLPTVLTRLAQSLEQDVAIRNRVRSALLYPTIILVVGVLAIFVLFSFVLPRLSVLFEDFGAELPWPTKMVMAVSQFLGSYWWLILLLIAAAGYYLKQWLSAPQGQHRLSVWLLSLPLVSDFIRDAEIARFSRTLGTLLEGGVPIPSALETCVGVMDNAVFAKETKVIAQKVQTGTSLTQALRSSPSFDELAVNLVMVGEQSGRLERGLFKLAQINEDKTKQFTENFMTILGPVMLLFIVGSVGLVIAAMILPMLRMNMIIN